MWRLGVFSKICLFGKSKLKLVGKGSLLQPCTALPDLAIRLHTVHLQLFFRNGAHRTVQYVCVFPTNHPGGTQYLTIVFLSFPEHLSYQPYNTLQCCAVTQCPTLVFTFWVVPYNSLTHCSPYGWQAQAIWLAEERPSWVRGGNRKVDVANESRSLRRTPTSLHVGVRPV